MKKIAIAISAAVLVFLLSSCSECDTAECWNAKAAFEKQQAEAKERREAAENAFRIERLKAEAEIEKAKPESVRLQEAKNQETTAGEWIETAAKIGAGVYIGAKVLDVLTR